MKAILRKNGLTIHDMDLMIPHQANLRIILSTAKKLDLSPEKAYVNIQKYGNTSGATIPIALSEMCSRSLLKTGDLILTFGFGAGLTYGGNLIRW